MIAALIAILSASAYQPMKVLTISDQLNAGAEVVAGRITDAETYRTEDADGEFLLTDLVLELYEPHRGSIEARVVLPGGTIGDETHMVGGAPRLFPGDEIVVVAEYRNERYYPTSWAYGLFTRADDANKGPVPASYSRREIRFATCDEPLKSVMTFGEAVNDPGDERHYITPKEYEAAELMSWVEFVEKVQACQPTKATDNASVQ